MAHFPQFITSKPSPSPSVGTVFHGPPPSFPHPLGSQSCSLHPNGAIQRYPLTLTASIPAFLDLVPSTARVALVNERSSFSATQSRFPWIFSPATGQTLALLPAPLPPPGAENTSPFANLGDHALRAFSTLCHLHSLSNPACLQPDTVHACLPPPRPPAPSTDSPVPRPTNPTAPSCTSQAP